MGCDIHGWVEKKVGEKWIAYKELNDTWRNYDRFAALAGVRGEGPKAKGVPPDVSDTVKVLIAEWDADGHSHSYLPLNEAFDVFKRTQFIRDVDYGLYDAFKIELDAMTPPESIDLYRPVFWFDN